MKQDNSFLDPSVPPPDPAAARRAVAEGLEQVARQCDDLKASAERAKLQQARAFANLVGVGARKRAASIREGLDV